MSETRLEVGRIKGRVLSVAVLALAGWLGFACGGKPEVEPVQAVQAVAPAEELEEAEEDAPVARVSMIPEDLPRYPGATLLDMDNESFEEGLTVTFESPDPVDSIRAYYDRELPAAGWQIEVSKRISDAYIIFAHKGDVEANIDVTEGGPTTTIEWSLYPFEEE